MSRLILTALVSCLPLATAAAQTSSSLQRSVDKVLHAPEYRQLRATETNGIVTLTGSVALLKAKLDIGTKFRS